VLLTRKKKNPLKKTSKLSWDPRAKTVMSKYLYQKIKKVNIFSQWYEYKKVRLDILIGYLKIIIITFRHLCEWHKEGVGTEKTYWG